MGQDVAAGRSLEEVFPGVAALPRGQIGMPGTEHPTRPFGGDHLDLGIPGRPFGSDGDHVAFHVQVYRVGSDAGKVELDDKRVAIAPGIHRHHRGPRQSAVRAQELLGQLVQLAERSVRNSIAATSRSPVLRTLQLGHRPLGNDL